MANSYVVTSDSGRLPFAFTDGQMSSLKATLTLKETRKIGEYLEKFQEKFFKIYKKLNIKLCSRQVLKEELASDKPLLLALDAISGHLNKVYNQTNQFLQYHDEEIAMYKDIIANKLKPQL